MYNSNYKMIHLIINLILNKKKDNKKFISVSNKIFINNFK